MDQEKLLSKQDLCKTDEPSACTSHCPIHVDVKGMTEEISKGNFDKAYKLLTKKLPFPKIISRVCDRVCENKCSRKNVGGSISIGQLEKAAVEYGFGKPPRSFPIPKNAKTVAVIGGGISGLTAALDLDKKGYAITIYEKENKLGGRLWSFPKDVLPDDIIEEELQVIYKSDIKLKLNTEITMDQVDSLTAEYDAVYIGTGKKTDMKVDSNTFETEKKGVFAGGITEHGLDSVIFSLSSGRRAAISIDRYVQNKSLTAARENEGSFATPLKLNLKNISEVPAVKPQNNLNFTREEAVREASRCMKCQCIECMKACSHLQKFNTIPKSYIRKINHNEAIIMGDHYANKMINSCNMCGLCGEVCPSNLNMSDIIHDTRKSMVERGKMPPSAHDFALKDMAFSTSDKFYMVKHQPGFDKSRYLFFPGCQLSGSSPDYVTKAYKYLIDNTDEGVGVMLGCCGAPAEWAGREDMFEKNIKHLKQQWKSMGKPTFIVACSSCKNTIEKYIPEIKYISLWEFMSQHGIPENRNVKGNRTFAIHDACTARYNKEFHESARDIVKKTGHEIEELEFSKEKTKCCGYGGLVYYANKEHSDESIKERAKESDRDYVVYCAMCRDLFAEHGKRSLHVLDLLYGEDLDKLAQKKPPRLWERRINRCKTKSELLKMWGEDYISESSEKDENNKTEIILPDNVKDIMEKRWILLQDVEQVIREAEETGEKFINPENGHNLARKRLENVTYWVEYEKKEDKYIVYDTYSHRMEVVEGNI